MVWIATRGDQPPLASIPRVTPGPTASRTARTRATSPSGSIPTLTFITVKPWLTAQAATSAARAGSRPETEYLVGTNSRTGPHQEPIEGQPGGLPQDVPAGPSPVPPW